jgi:Tfp pilus assembly ATPase PilU
MRLSRSLAAVLSQSLVPRKDTPGRVAALEIMVVTPTVQKYIEDGKPADVYGAIVEGEHWGMQTKNQALIDLYGRGLISANAAQFYAGNATEMRQMLRRFDAEQADAERQANTEQARAARADALRQRPSTDEDGSAGGAAGPADAGAGGG